MSVFAGFWVDGAVRLPKYKDSDCGMVFVKSKEGFDELLDIVCVDGVDVTADHFWLDTSPRESLTPEELWSLVKVLFPSAVNVERVKGGEWMWNGGKEVSPHINWGNLTRYPPPVGEQWIQVTKENVSQHIFNQCRYRNFKGMQSGEVVGWDGSKDKCLVMQATGHIVREDAEVRVQANS